MEIMKFRIFSKLFRFIVALLLLGNASSGTKFLIHPFTNCNVGLQSYTVPTYTPAPNPT